MVLSDNSTRFDQHRLPHMTIAVSDSTSAKDRDLARWLSKQVGLIVVVIAVTAMAAAIVQVLGPSRRVAIPILLGSLFGIVNALAVWIALGPFPLVWRILTTCFFIPIAYAATVIVLPWIVAAPIQGDDASLLIAIVGQFVLLQVPLWVLRRIFRLELVQVRDSSDRRDNSLQFRLAHMLIGVTLIAVILRVGLSVWDPLLSHLNTTPELRPFCMFVGLNLLLIWPALWAVLGGEAVGKRLLLSLLLLAAMTICEPFVFSAALRAKGLPPAIFYWVTNVAQWLVIVGHLAITRSHQYRLVRAASARSN
jgi:hypothetical protein